MFMDSNKYPKFKKKEECAFPERDICNWDYSKDLPRCKYMKYNNSKSIFDPKRWECTYKKQVKDKQKRLTHKGEKE